MSVKPFKVALSKTPVLFQFGPPAVVAPNKSDYTHRIFNNAPAACKVLDSITDSYSVERAFYSWNELKELLERTQRTPLKVTTYIYNIRGRLKLVIST